METPETTPTPDRPCPSCGAAMAPAQDWCLECGTAAPGRLTGGSRAGFRAAATIITTVLLLVGGAVAASYAALNSEAQKAATAPAPPSAAPQVAQAPPTVTTPPPAPPPATTPAPTPPPAPAPAPAPKPAPAPAPTPAPTPPPATPSTPSKPTTPTRKPGESRPIDLGVDIADVYDPYNSAVDQTDPSDSYDENPKTVFTVSTDTSGDMAVGLDFDLELPKLVEKVYFRTTTPGFKVEVYGAKGSLPPDILDNRWHKLASATNAGADKGADGLEKLTFAPGKYRHIVLWFTTPPPTVTKPGQTTPTTATVGISEVRILD